MHVGIPSMASSLVAPLTTAFITWQVAQFGQEAVAGFGIASRVEGLSLMVLMALGAAVTPFAGQNYGAKSYDRVMGGMRFAYRWSMIYGAVIAGDLLLCFVAYRSVVYRQSRSHRNSIDAPWPGALELWFPRHVDDQRERI